MKLRFSVFAAFLIFSAIPQLSAQSYFAEDGYVEFISRAPLLEFKGTSNHLTGKIDIDENTIDFYVDLNTLDTGNRRRDRDMREVYLKTNEFPFAEYFGNMINRVNLDKHEGQPVTVSGKFTIHGVEKEMNISGMITPAENHIHVKASWTILLNDHNIDRPSVVFYELADEQTVNINITLPKQ